MGKQKTIVVGAGPVGALAALYAAKRGDDVHVYELRAGKKLLNVKSLFPLWYLSLYHGISVPSLSFLLFC